MALPHCRTSSLPDGRAVAHLSQYTAENDIVTCPPVLSSCNPITSCSRKECWRRDPSLCLFLRTQHLQVALDKQQQGKAVTPFSLFLKSHQRFPQHTLHSCLCSGSPNAQRPHGASSRKQKRSMRQCLGSAQKPCSLLWCFTYFSSQTVSSSSLWRLCLSELCLVLMFERTRDEKRVLEGHSAPPYEGTGPQ